MKTADIQIRDPFIYVKDGYYYLYGSTDADIWKTRGHGFEGYRSRDLIDWEDLGNVLDRPEGYWGEINFWAPELHEYKGCCYLFASFKGTGFERGTAVFKADKPEGPFRPWSRTALTPPEWSCLDGTLYVEDGQPYLVFCHEWTQIGDGEICRLPLTQDLSAPAGEPVTLFKATDAKWPKLVHHSSGKDGYVTDGPFMYTNVKGELLMLWSTLSQEGYALTTAKSASGKLEGPWLQRSTPFFNENGGHGMLFRNLDGELMLTLHSPNQTPFERAQFIKVDEATLFM